MTSTPYRYFLVKWKRKTIFRYSFGLSRVAVSVHLLKHEWNRRELQTRLNIAVIGCSELLSFTNTFRKKTALENARSGRAISKRVLGSFLVLTGLTRLQTQRNKLTAPCGVLLLTADQQLKLCTGPQVLLLNFVIQWLTLPLRILELTGSNLGQETGYPDWDLLWFPSVPPGKSRDGNFGHDRFLLYSFFFIVH
jgi:hypothetical protein